MQPVIHGQQRKSVLSTPVAKTLVVACGLNRIPDAPGPDHAVNFLKCLSPRRSLGDRFADHYGCGPSGCQDGRIACRPQTAAAWVASRDFFWTEDGNAESWSGCGHVRTPFPELAQFDSVKQQRPARQPCRPKVVSCATKTVYLRILRFLVEMKKKIVMKYSWESAELSFGSAAAA